jgi:hypothetical protein
MRRTLIRWILFAILSAALTYGARWLARKIAKPEA